LNQEKEKKKNLFLKNKKQSVIHTDTKQHTNNTATYIYKLQYCGLGNLNFPPQITE